MLVGSLIEDVDGSDLEIVVVVDGPDPLVSMLADAFDGKRIDVDLDGSHSPAALADDRPGIAEALESEGSTAVLFEDGEPTAASSMATLYDSLLAINSDLFVTGARELGEIELPDVLAGLADTRLRLRGYPLAHREKLLLILLSRYLEQSAFAIGVGTLRAAFQSLSRIDDEVGTRAVYERLERTDVDVHLYGVDDGARPDLEATTHLGDGPAYRDSWFVVFRPAGSDALDVDRSAVAAEGGALVCREVEPRIWEGFFTFEPDRVAAIDDAIATGL
ncbi:histidine kinase [Natrarchaeobius oligotrophus]|uniref:Histidine kinase n=1 Tax=Natrarchaeobius chitinivorans TaxID=1679083 RepID=A0A3N6NQD5_NATCH|nr:histidine kinase [Natrarchaeobius chitinivorans]RQH02043.1 histidine kinase [Natrarchaeobius chitinivorans]